MDIGNCKTVEGIWKLEKYGKWEVNRWTEVQGVKGDLSLIFKNMQLMIVHKETLLESISLLSDFQRIAFTNGTLGIAIRYKDCIRKFRVLFASCGLHSGAIMGKQCVTVLKKFIQIHDKSSDSLDLGPTDVPIYERVSKFLSKDLLSLTTGSNSRILSHNFPTEDIVKSCILDPDFPDFVSKVNSILEKAKQT